MPIHPGRFAALIEGDFVVFVIGARINKLWAVSQPLAAGHQRHATHAAGNWLPSLNSACCTPSRSWVVAQRFRPCSTGARMISSTATLTHATAPTCLRGQPFKKQPAATPPSAFTTRRTLCAPVRTKPSTQTCRSSVLAGPVHPGPGSWEHGRCKRAACFGNRQACRPRRRPAKLGNMSIADNLQRVRGRNCCGLQSAPTAIRLLWS